MRANAGWPTEVTGSIEVGKLGKLPYDLGCGLSLALTCQFLRRRHDNEASFMSASRAIEVCKKLSSIVLQCRRANCASLMASTGLGDIVITKLTGDAIYMGQLRSRELSSQDATPGSHPKPDEWTYYVPPG